MELYYAIINIVDYLALNKNTIAPKRRAELIYILDDLQKHLDNLLYAITKSGVLSSQIQEHECISGEGRRLGLRVLVQRGDKSISEIGRIIAKLEQITRNGVDPMHYAQNGRLTA